ncbi:LacI family transcriptional regulator [Brachybacterium vulturis]|uniref:LacI family transcriptional regulator n=1 Tax=Brachybacterium vulturis TaxID=2017484 RepID=A0A291GN93_9MICO|nr:LacI family DNA-binding transcriptional regulator [Brachybacterium vulturis]ATG51691.1 LacI family transcriptional regulator [Brachybacterium vulturis]
MSAEARRATIVDVAERAGVSRQTVSRAMNDQSGISIDTRERVLAAARELNYRPSRFGRGLVEQGPITLGLVVEDLSNAYFAELGAAVVRACAPYGWNVVLSEALHAPHPDQVAGDLARRVDALVGYGVLTADIRGKGGMPVVQLDGRPSQLAEGGVIELVREPAMAALAQHLLEAGARRPVVLDLVGGLGRSRSLALASALRPLVGGGVVPVREVDARERHREALEEILADGTDTIVAFNDELAVRLLRTLRSLGKDVPGQVRLVGVDGLEIASLVTPELTTLSLDIETVARETVSLVAGMLDGSVPLSGEAAHRAVPYQLEVRASS